MEDTHPAPQISREKWLPFLGGFLVLWAVLVSLGELDSAGMWGIPILLAVAIVALVVERTVFAAPFGCAVATLGLGRPGWRALVVAFGVSALVLLVFPLTITVTGARLSLVEDWPVALISLFAYNGLVEELVWRGYAFRHLSEGRTFLRAALWTMPLIAATHIPIVVQNGPVVGIGAMLVAAVTSLPFAHLYLAGSRTIWAPAILHTAIDSFKLVIIPAAAAIQFSLLLIAVSLVIPLLVLLVPRRLLTHERKEGQ